MTGSYVLDFKHEDVNEPRPWPVGIKDGIVTSGLGDDDGSTLIGFAIQGEQRAVFLADQIEAIDWDQDELVPVFSNAGGFFNWDIPIRGIRKIEVSTDPAHVGPGATHTVDLPKLDIEALHEEARQYARTGAQEFEAAKRRGASPSLIDAIADAYFAGATR